MALTFKPRKQQIHVPGHGVVQKEEFNENHFKILMKRAGGTKEEQDAFIKQYFVVSSYGDLPVFQEPDSTLAPELQSEQSEAPEEPKEKKTRGSKKKAEQSEA